MSLFDIMIAHENLHLHFPIDVFCAIEEGGFSDGDTIFNISSTCHGFENCLLAKMYSFIRKEQVG